MTQVRGQEAVQFDGRYLSWHEPSGAAVELICEPPVDNLTEIADSLELIAPDDPRLP